MGKHRKRQSGIFHGKDYLYTTNIVAHLLIFVNTAIKKTKGRGEGMAIPKGAVLTIGGCTPDGARYVTMCINRISYGIYKAYLQRGGACYKLYPMKGQRYFPPAPVDPFVVPVVDIVSGYSYY